MLFAKIVKKIVLSPCNAEECRWFFYHIVNNFKHVSPNSSKQSILWKYETAISLPRSIACRRVNQNRMLYLFLRFIVCQGMICVCTIKLISLSEICHLYFNFPDQFVSNNNV